MNDEERRHLRELLRTHRSRLRVLELQAATFGAHAPPHVITEMGQITTDIAAIEAQLGQPMPTVDRAALRQLQQQALRAYYAEDWERAEALLIQVVQANPADQDAQTKLDHAQRQLDLRAFYQAIHDPREAGNWRAILAALDDLDQREPDYPGAAEQRQWAEAQRTLAELPGVTPNRTDQNRNRGSDQAIEKSEQEIKPIPILFSKLNIRSCIFAVLAISVVSYLGWIALTKIQIPLNIPLSGSISTDMPPLSTAPLPSATAPLLSLTAPLPSQVTPLPSLTPLPISVRFFNVYTDAGASDNHFTPSGKMGDTGDIEIAEDWMVNPHSGTTSVVSSSFRGARLT